jgi:hypothetical protein
MSNDAVTTRMIQAAWHRSVIPLVAENSRPVAAVYAAARPIVRDGWLVVCQFDSELRACAANKRTARERVEGALFEITGEELSVGVTW